MSLWSWHPEFGQWMEEATFSYRSDNKRTLHERYPIPVRLRWLPSRVSIDNCHCSSARRLNARDCLAKGKL